MIRRISNYWLPSLLLNFLCLLLLCLSLLASSFSLLFLNSSVCASSSACSELLFSISFLILFLSLLLISFLSVVNFFKLSSSSFDAFAFLMHFSRLWPPSGLLVSEGSEWVVKLPALSLALQVPSTLHTASNLVWLFDTPSFSAESILCSCLPFFL